MDKYRSFRKGLIDALPVVLGVFPVGVAYGLLARATGLNGFEAVAMSMIVFAGSAQFVGLGLIGSGAGAMEIILTTFLVNLRHILYSSTLAPFLRGVKKGCLALISFGIVDETFAVSIARVQEEEVDEYYLLVLNFTFYFCWIGSSLLGVTLGLILPSFLKEGLNFALYAIFIGLLVLQLNSRRTVLVSLLAALFSTILYLVIPGKWNLIIATAIAATGGVVLEKWV